LSQETARNIVSFHERRMKLREAQIKTKDRKAAKGLADDDDDIVAVPSPSVIPFG
jgi:hypothetical protein